VTFSFDASSRLAKQIEAASPADLFFSADTDWMDYLDQRGLIDKATRVNLLGNALVVVVPAASTATFGSVKNLSRPEVKPGARGRDGARREYARAALTSAGAWEAGEGSRRERRERANGARLWPATKRMRDSCTRQTRKWSGR
jgi:molybdate transport system substrate-binding protein